MHKAKQSQDRKGLKFFNVLITKEHRAESDKSSWFAHPSEKSAGKRVFCFCCFLIGKVSLSHEVPDCQL